MELVVAVTDYFSPKTIETLADSFGAGADQVKKGIAALAPAILAATSNRLAESSGPSLFKTLSESPLTDALAKPEPHLEGPHWDAADDYVRTVFGIELTRVVDTVSSRCGLAQQTTTELVNAVGAVVMGVLGREIAAGTTHNGLVGMLAQNRSAIAAALPNEIKNLAGVSAQESVAPPQPVRWFWPVVLGAGVLFALYTWKRAEDRTNANTIRAAKPISSGYLGDERAEHPSTEPSRQKTTSPQITAIGFRKAVSSDEGELEIVGPAGGVEAKLLAFIEDPDSVVDANLWFNFDSLKFKRKSAKLDMKSSAAQLNNMVAILKAFPNVYIKIGGHTRNIGNNKKSLKLSAQRASHVTDVIVKRGIDSDRIESEGFGAQYPICPTSNDNNCRSPIAMQVLAK